MVETREPGLTPFGRSLTAGGAVMLVAGLAFGNFPYLIVAVLLMGVAFSARGLASPQVEAARVVGADDLRAGDHTRIQLTLTQRGAQHTTLTIHDVAPDSFTLEEGSNFEATHLRPGQGASLDYTLGAPRRGSYLLGPLHVTAHDPLFLQAAKTTTIDNTHEVVIHPRAAPVPRIRTSSAWGRTHLPGGDRSDRGILTNDFRELRPYQRGDPLKQVNWKATARMSQDDLHLIVNDYEVEGKKVVWVFVDASPYTIGGTTLTNHFDELATSALAVVGHYLDMGHRVGFALYGAGETRLLYADTGDLHRRRIVSLLATTEPGEPGDHADAAVQLAKGFLARERPLTFFFTLPGRDAQLGRALVQARALASSGRRAAPVILVAPMLHDAPPGESEPDIATRLLAVREAAQLKGLERRGVTVIRYRAGGPPLSALLSKGVIG